MVDGLEDDHVDRVEDAQVLDEGGDVVLLANILE